MARKSLARRGVRILCGDPDIKNLTQAQLNALHLCKHEVLAAVRKLYPVLKPEKADEILIKYFERMIKEDQGQWDPKKDKA